MEYCLGNPEKVEGNIKCSQCRQISPFSLKTIVIDNKSRGEAKAILARRKHFIHKCEHCGAERYITHSFFYVENSAKINGVEYGQWAIQLINDEEKAIEFAKHIDELRKMPEHKDDWTTYRVRVVCNKYDFYEKLAIVISLADDRVIEQIKRNLRTEFEIQTGRKVVKSEFLFEDGKMLIRLRPFDSDDVDFQITPGEYQNALDELAQTPILDNDNDIIVNQAMFECKTLSKKGYQPIHRR